MLQAFRYFGFLTMAPLIGLHCLLCCSAFQMGGKLTHIMDDNWDLGYKRKAVWHNLPQRERGHFWPALAPCSLLAWAFIRKWAKTWKSSQFLISILLGKISSKCVFVLVHGDQNSAYGVWYNKGRSEYHQKFIHGTLDHVMIQFHWPQYPNFISSRVIGESTTRRTRTHCMWLNPSLSLSSSFLFKASSFMLSLAPVQVSIGISLLHSILFDQPHLIIFWPNLIIWPYINLLNF